MRILITGGEGYIAKSLYNGLKDKHDITLISRKQVDLTNSEQVDYYLAGEPFFDVVIHAAVMGGSRLKSDDNNTLDNNLKMYFNLIDNHTRFNKFIHFGSGAEIHAPDTLYGMSKAAIAKSMLSKDNCYNIVIYGVFDENELDTRFIKSNILNYIDKKPIEIHENKQMDFFYMKDLVTLVDHYILNDNLPKTIDCTYKKTYTLETIAGFIQEQGNYEVKVNIEYESDVRYKGMFRDLGIEYIGLEEGIKQTYGKLKNGN